jgi:tRNA(fMet)-specific endonuclease VapC
MNPLYLLDANVLSEPTRARPNEAVIRRLRREEGRVATSAVVIHELLFGVERLPPSKRRQALSEYLDALLASDLPILPYDLAAAKWHARERTRLEAKGRPVPFRDSQIAAIAQTQGLVVVTANVRDFEPFESLEIENWSIG